MPSDEYMDAFLDEFRAQITKPVEKPQKGVCRFNKSVDCPAVGNKCAKCGWNPVVAELRSQDIRRRLDLEKD